MIWVIMDFLICHISILLALYLRFSWNGFVIPQEDWTAYIQMSSLFGVIPVFILLMRGNYKVHYREFHSKDYFELGFSCFLGVIALVSISFYIRTLNFSRIVYLFYGLLIFGFSAGIRSVFQRYHRKLWENNQNLENLLVIGNYEDLKNSKERLCFLRKSGYCIHSWILSSPNTKDQTIENYGFRVVSDESEIENLICKKEISGMVLFHGVKKMAEYGYLSVYHGIRCFIIPEMSDLLIPLTRFTQLNQEIIMELKPPEGFDPYDMFKRILDIFTSGFLMIILSPFFLLIAFLIRKDSPGNAFFKQKRVGKNGKEFWIMKFRTMGKDADNGPLLTEENDIRITRIGKFLRMWSLDELPQLWNIFIGDMSLVGPRPEIPELVKDYNEWQKMVLSIRPGLSGLAQVSGRDRLTIAEKLKIDVYYIQNQCLWMDFWVLWRTIFVVLSQEGAN